jgi:hypothetical protein
MKKNVIFMFAVLFMAVSFLSFQARQDSIAASKQANGKIFSGRVIFVADNYIELKKGNKEVTVYFADNTRFISKDGKENSKSIITVCQYIEAYYTDGAKKILTKIIVKKESDCDK